MNILKERRDFSGGEGSEGLPCQPEIQLFCAQEVEDGGEDSGVPVDEDLRRRGAEDEFSKERGLSEGSCPSSYPATRSTHGSGLIFQRRDASAQKTARRGRRAGVKGRGVCAGRGVGD